MKSENSSNNAAGLGYAILAFTAWGFLPLYWKALKQVPAGEILAHRIFWSFILVAVILYISNRWQEFKEVISNPSKRWVIILSSLLISSNWFIYIWAVNANHVVEASLGYYINPLISVFLGMAVLRERLNFWQLVSLLLATVGVIIITMGYGKVPWIAISLALTFGFYGLVKKMANLDSIIGLALETLMVVPVALVYIITKEADGTGSFGMTSISTTILLILSGVVTAMPLLWFAQGAQRITLSTLGFIQYLGPTISLFLGVFIFKESFTKTHILSFGFIWFALILYSFSRTTFMNHRQPNYFKESKCVE